MSDRLIFGFVVMGLLSGCGSGEEYNNLPPEPSATNAVSQSNKKTINKPPVAPKKQQSAPVE